ncbi:MAG: hypothetical protein Q9209_004162 [Squamulea sp. 1 TL-2023]
MALLRWDISEVKSSQVCQALEQYQNNGAMWRFDGKRVVETMIDFEDKVSDARVKQRATVNNETEVEDAITSVPATARVRTRSESVINAKYDAQVAELEKILIENEPQSAAAVVTTPTPQKSAKAHRVDFWLPATKSQLDLTMQEDKKIDQRRVGESMFTLPTRGSSKAAEKDMIHHSESMYRLPLPRPVRRVKAKEVKWKETTTKEHKKKVSSGKKEGS